MKKLFALLMALCLALTAVALAESEALEDWPVQDDPDDIWTDAAEGTGEWEITDMDSAKGGEGLRQLLVKAVEEMAGVTYTPAALLGTRTGSGTEYCILCHCAYVSTDTGETGWSLVYLAESLGGEVKVTNVVNLDVGALSDYGIFH